MVRARTVLPVPTLHFGPHAPVFLLLLIYFSSFLSLNLYSSSHEQQWLQPLLSLTARMSCLHWALASGCCGQPLIPHWAQQEQPHSHQNVNQVPASRPWSPRLPPNPSCSAQKSQRALSDMFSIQPSFFSSLSSGSSPQFGFPPQLREKHLIHWRF